MSRLADHMRAVIKGEALVAEKNLAEIIQEDLGRVNQALKTLGYSFILERTAGPHPFVTASSSYYIVFSREKSPPKTLLKITDHHGPVDHPDDGQYTLRCFTSYSAPIAVTGFRSCHEDDVLRAVAAAVMERVHESHRELLMQALFPGTAHQDPVLSR